MRGKLMASLNHGVKVIIANKNDRAVKVKSAGNQLSTLVVNQLALAHPRNAAALSCITYRLKQVEANVVKEYGVGVIENNNVVVMAVMIKQLHKASRTNVSLNNNVIVALWIPLTKALLNSETLTQTSRTRNNKRTCISNNTSLSQRVKNFKSLRNAGINLSFRLTLTGQLQSLHRVATDATDRNSLWHINPPVQVTYYTLLVF